MVTTEKRRHIRINSLNLSDVVVNEEGDIVLQGMGRTLNVSESGILLQTHFGIDIDQIVSLTIAFGEELLNLRGRVAHSKKGDEETSETGIEFLDVDESSRQVLKRFIKAFEERNKNKAER
jgi:c-di-GMP-binding flagellar brake protein YcgR